MKLKLNNLALALSVFAATCVVTNALADNKLSTPSETSVSTVPSASSEVKEENIDKQQDQQLEKQPEKTLEQKIQDVKLTQQQVDLLTEYFGISPVDAQSMAQLLVFEFGVDINKSEDLTKEKLDQWLGKNKQQSKSKEELLKEFSKLLDEASAINEPLLAKDPMVQSLLSSDKGNYGFVTQTSEWLVKETTTVVGALVKEPEVGKEQPQPTVEDDKVKEDKTKEPAKEPVKTETEAPKVETEDTKPEGSTDTVSTDEEPKEKEVTQSDEGKVTSSEQTENLAVEEKSSVLSSTGKGDEQDQEGAGAKPKDDPKDPPTGAPIEDKSSSQTNPQPLATSGGSSSSDDPSKQPAPEETNSNVTNPGESTSIPTNEKENQLTPSGGSTQPTSSLQTEKKVQEEEVDDELDEGEGEVDEGDSQLPKASSPSGSEEQQPGKEDPKVPGDKQEPKLGENVDGKGSQTEPEAPVVSPSDPNNPSATPSIPGAVPGEGAEPLKSEDPKQSKGQDEGAQPRSASESDVQSATLNLRDAESNGKYEEAEESTEDEKTKALETLKKEIAKTQLEYLKESQNSTKVLDTFYSLQSSYLDTLESFASIENSQRLLEKARGFSESGLFVDIGTNSVTSDTVNLTLPFLTLGANYKVTDYLTVGGYATVAKLANKFDLGIQRTGKTATFGLFASTKVDSLYLALSYARTLNKYDESLKLLTLPKELNGYSLTNIKGQKPTLDTFAALVSYDVKTSDRLTLTPSFALSHTNYQGKDAAFQVISADSSTDSNTNGSTVKDLAKINYSNTKVLDSTFGLDAKYQATKQLSFTAGLRLGYIEQQGANSTTFGTKYDFNTLGVAVEKLYTFAYGAKLSSEYRIDKRHNFNFDLNYTRISKLKVNNFSAKLAYTFTF